MQTNLSFLNQNTPNNEDELIQTSQKTQQLTLNELGKALRSFGIWTIISIIGIIITYSGVTLYWVYFPWNQYVNFAFFAVGIWICAFNITRKILTCYLCISHLQLLRAYHLTLTLLFVQTLMVISLLLLNDFQYYMYPMLFFANTSGGVIPSTEYAQYTSSSMMLYPWYYISFDNIVIAIICISVVTFFIFGFGIIKAFRTFTTDYFSSQMENDRAALRITQGMRNLQKGIWATVILFLFPLFGLLWVMRGYYQFADGLIKYTVEPSQIPSVQRLHSDIADHSSIHALPQTPTEDVQIHFCPYCGNRSEVTLARYCAQCGASFMER